MKHATKVYTNGLFAIVDDGSNAAMIHHVDSNGKPTGAPVDGISLAHCRDNAAPFIRAYLNDVLDPTLPS